MTGPALLFMTIWAIWLLSWIIAARWSAPAEKTAASPLVWLYRVMILAGALLLWHRSGRLLGMRRLWHVGYEGGYLLAALALAGIVFTWYARIHLGRLWSGSITRKVDHHVVDSGPYSMVRHPIYTGLLLATWATAIAQAMLTGILGAVLISAALWIKAGIEERFLEAELGRESYGAYRSRVPMLIPLPFRRPLPHRRG